MECKWYKSCPMVKFNEQGQLSDAYVSRFCKGNFEQCCHYRDAQTAINPGPAQAPEDTDKSQIVTSKS